MQFAQESPIFDVVYPANETKPNPTMALYPALYMLYTIHAQFSKIMLMKRFHSLFYLCHTDLHISLRITQYFIYSILLN